MGVLAGVQSLAVSQCHAWRRQIVAAMITLTWIRPGIEPRAKIENGEILNRSGNSLERKRDWIFYVNDLWSELGKFRHFLSCNEWLLTWNINSLRRCCLTCWLLPALSINIKHLQHQQYFPLGSKLRSSSMIGVSTQCSAPTSLRNFICQ